MTIIKKFEPEEIKHKLPKRYIVLVILSLFALTMIEIWTSNTYVTYGERLDSLLNRSQGLDLENQILENEIAKNTSLNSVASKSASLGFSKSESIQYIR